MSKKIAQNKKYTSSSDTTRNPLLIPLIFIISILPLIVRMKIYNANLSEFPWFSADDTQTDFFLYYKSLFFILTSFIIAALLLWMFLRSKSQSKSSSNLIIEDGKYKFTKLLIPLGIYGLLALLSTVFSKYSSYGFNGIFEQFESIYVLLGYCLVVYYAYIVVNSQEDVSVIIKWLTISVLVMCLLGLTQATGHSFYESTMGKKLIVPSANWDILDQLRFAFEKNRVYLSLYNPNYVGLYTSLISPILLMLLFFAKDIKLKAVYSISILGLLLCMIGSSSRNGFVALCISLLFILILLRKLILKHWKFFTSVSMLIIVGFFVINAYMGNTFVNRLKLMFTDTQSHAYNLTSIQTNDDHVAITYKGNSLSIYSEPAPDGLLTYLAIDSNGVQMPMTFEPTTYAYTITDPLYPFTITPVNLDDVLGFGILIDGVNWYFSNFTSDGSYYYYNSYGKFDKIVDAESLIFTNHERIGSGRGYIWSRTIPLLKNHVILGTGADTFSIAFPHNDYLGRQHNGYGATVITKPHNMYLQMATQTGVFSVIAFLVFYGMYFISTLRLCWNNTFETYMSQISAAILVGTIGYMISGLFNDSTITVSPVFWALMGVGLAVNHRCKQAKF